MKLKEAIEILTPLTKARREGLSLEEALAVQLGIEALKRFQAARLARTSMLPVLLPGETED